MSSLFEENARALEDLSEITIACMRTNLSTNNPSVSIHTANLFDFRTYLDERFFGLLSDNILLYSIYTESSESNERNITAMCP